MTKMTIKTIKITDDYHPMTWTNETLDSFIEDNYIVGYLFVSKNNSISAINLYLAPIDRLHKIYKSTDIITLDILQVAFIQWLELLTIDSKSYQFRNPPLQLWLETRLNWIHSIAIKVHQKFGTDVTEALSTAYMTILTLYKKTNVYIGNLYYLEIAIFTAIKKEHAFMKNRLSGNHPNAIHLDASPGEFNRSIQNDVTSFHEIITAPSWKSEEEKRYDEIWAAMELDMREEFSEREIDQIKRGNVHMNIPLYRRLLKWRKTHKKEDYL